MILALVAFASIVLADPQFRLPTWRPFTTAPRVTPGRPTPVPGPYRNPGIPPRRPIPPRTGGRIGRFGRQVDFNSLFASIQNSTRIVPGFTSGPGPIALPAGLPGIPVRTRLG